MRNLTVICFLLLSSAAACEAASQLEVRLHFKGESSEFVGLTDGAAVQPFVAPPGVVGTLSLLGAGGVSFLPALEGTGVAFQPGGYQAAGAAFFQFRGRPIGLILDGSEGEISFALKSSYSFAERAALPTPNTRRVFEAWDLTGRQFGFETTVNSRRLVFACQAPSYSPTAGITGNSRTALDFITAVRYTVPEGAEDAVFGKGVVAQFRIQWDQTGTRLYLNGVLVASNPSPAVARAWTESAAFSIGASVGVGRNTGKYVCDDVIDEFVVKAPAPSSDSIPPSILLTAPTSGSVVGDVVNIIATATDNVGVTGVRFWLDGQPLGDEKTAVPYSMTWDTTLVASGVHTLSATARDAAGNTGASAPVQVTVYNAPPGMEVVVSTASELTSAIAAARPGQRIVLRPGTYVLPDRLRFFAENSGASGLPVTVMARDGLGSVVIDANGNEEAFYVISGRYLVLQGLVITGGAYHAIKIDGPSSDVVIRNCRLFDNTRANGVYDQTSAIKGGPGAGLPYRVTIEDCEIYQAAPFAGVNFQGIDCNACKDWVVRNNRIHDIRGATLAGMGIQFKSGSSNTVIENNRIWNCGLTGINFGGFGVPAWGNETFDHVGGIVRNNVVYGAADAGISVINTKDGKVFNNTLFRNGYNPDVRVRAENLQYRNNILDQPLLLRDGAAAATSNNYVLPFPSSGFLFVNAAAGDFHLTGIATPVIDQGAYLASDVPCDRDGKPRPYGSGFDIGAYEYYPAP